MALAPAQSATASSVEFTYFIYDYFAPSESVWVHGASYSYDENADEIIFVEPYYEFVKITGTDKPRARLFLQFVGLLDESPVAGQTLSLNGLTGLDDGIGLFHYHLCYGSPDEDDCIKLPSLDISFDNQADVTSWDGRASVPIDGDTYHFVSAPTSLQNLAESVWNSPWRYPSDLPDIGVYDFFPAALWNIDMLFANTVPGYWSSPIVQYACEDADGFSYSCAPPPGPEPVPLPGTATLLIASLIASGAYISRRRRT